jgi:tRNA-specific 2-thiouridylase
MKRKAINKRKVIVGLSGGVDSSVALILLKKQEFEPMGVTLKLPVWKNKVNTCHDNVCCTPASIKIAQKICQKLQVPYFVIEAQKEFQKEVITYFVKELKQYHTPNPCVMCNRNLKFQLLIELAEKMKIPYVATGHYAKIKLNTKTGLYELLKGKDKNKDQSYSLSFLDQKQLKYLILPLGNYAKSEVYKIAKKEGFPYFEKIKQSQNFCFVSNKALLLFIQKEIGINPGPIKNIKGNILGQHQGLYFYTLGQRKGLNLANGPFYVIDFNIKKNTLIVSKNKKDLNKKTAILSPLNIVSGKITAKKMKIQAKIRSRSPMASATLYFVNKNKAKIVFNKPQKAITPGQFCVFYQGQKCLGAGIIQE